MESIGEALRQEREKQGLTLDEVHEATRITAQNLSALEEDRFDSFPNKVYARAFLRDYANFLGLGSAELLERLEEALKGGVAAEPAPVAVRGRSWAFAYALLVIVLLVGLGAIAHLGWSAHDKRHRAAHDVASAPRHVKRHAIPSGGPEPVGKPVTKPAVPPVTPPPSVPANKLVLEVTALGTVWAHVDADGVKKLFGNIQKGQTLRFEAGKKIYIRVGRANAVKVTVNGVPKVLGDKSVAVTKEFTLPAQGAAGRSGP